MCGSACISVEGSLYFPTTYHIAGDINQEAIAAARQNVMGHRVDVLHWSVKSKIPLRQGKVSVFLT